MQPPKRLKMPRLKIMWLLYAGYAFICAVVGVVALEWLLSASYGDVWRAVDSSTYRREEISYPRLPKEFFRQSVRIPQVPHSVTYTIHGCRHPGDVRKLRLQQGSIQTLFIGDSFTFGRGVEDGEAFPAVYGKLTGTGARILNCGVYGSGTGKQLRQLTRVSRYEKHIRTLVYQIYGNDLLQDLGIPAGIAQKVGPLSLTKFLNWMIPYTLHLTLKPLFDRYLHLLGESRNYLTRRNSIFPAYGPALKEEILSRPDADLRRLLLPVYTSRVKKIIRMARLSRMKVVSFLIPYAAYIDLPTARTALVDLSRDIDEESHLRFRTFLSKLFRDASVPYLDLTESFLLHYQSNPGSRLYIEKDLHLNRLGNQMVAERMIQFVKESGGL